MATFTNIADLNGLPDMLAGGYVSRRKHPTAELYIYNYTARAQYDAVWNEATLACRGLITNAAGEVVARPFAKFFNLEQMQTLPDEPFEVFEKLDGSLGVLYWLDGTPYIATRGSFESEQSAVANELLRQRDHSLLDPACTYLFEIIYPKNKIVVDYGATRSLTLLAIIETRTGRERPLADVGFPVVKRYEDVTDLASLGKLQLANSEGFVVRFAGGLRVKVKLAEYVRLHRLLTGLTEQMILRDYLIPGRSLDELLAHVPDEFNAWVRDVLNHYQHQFDAIEREARATLAALPDGDRKAQAASITKTRYPGVAFAMLDGKQHATLIWRLVQPMPGGAFKYDEV